MSVFIQVQCMIQQNVDLKLNYLYDIFIKNFVFLQY